ncbi:Crp/Fnr family transcriptional regulator [Rhodobacter lacus]|uniref:Crp/Fnr family transcriptional regulator n=1 Tax=Rhodobacter lacus TaxID=1641972 RepID=A0ABW5A6E6_9RHOB
MVGTPCKSCPLRACSLFTPMDDDEVSFTQSIKRGELQVLRGTTLLLEGAASPQLFTVLSGMGIRYKTLEDGRRQVLNFVFPGDFIGLQAGLMGEMKHSVEAVTPMTLCVFGREDLWTMFRTSPERAFDMTWLAAIEEHFLGETIASLGQRDARERICWAIVRVFVRLRALGLASKNQAQVPFRQQHLADALGLSLVHTNKTLQALRRDKLLRWSEGVMVIEDLGRLADIAMIDLEKPETRPLL